MKTIRHFFIALCVLIFRFPAVAAPGDLNLSFGGTGKVATSVGIGDSGGIGMALQSDGKIVVAGYSVGNDGSNDFTVVRYNSDGSLDLNFNRSGKVITDFGGSNDFGIDVAIQSDGKIVVVGSSGTVPNIDFALARYNPDGSLDTDFNGTGKVTTDFSGSDDYARGVALQSDGKIVVTGYRVTGGYVFALARYNTNGGLDTSFGNSGKVTLDGTSNLGFGVAVQPDARIVVAGYGGGTNDSEDLSVIRFNPNGTLDGSFNAYTEVTGGEFLGNGNIQCNNTANLFRGMTITGGPEIPPGTEVFRVFSETTFGVTVQVGGPGTNLTFQAYGDGKVLSSIEGYDRGYAMALQGDGRIIVVGLDFQMMRYNSNGTWDTSFNGTGKQRSQLGNGVNEGGILFDVKVQSDGKIVTAGYFGDVVNSSNLDFLVLRYDANGTLDPSFNGTGIVKTDFGGYDVGWTMALQTDGKIVVAGYSRDATGYKFAVSRYEGNTVSLTPFQQWKLTQLGNANAPDLGDTDFDGLVHLAEYALNLSPTAPSLPPPAERHLYAEGERLRMFFTRDAARNDVTIAVQSADSPAGPWTTVAASTLGGVTTGTGYVGGDDATPGLMTVEVRDTVNISPATASRYLRVKVTH